MKTTRTLKRGMTILMGLVALCLAAGTAGAQTYKGEFNLADPVKWDQANLPAGEYTLGIRATGYEADPKSSIKLTADQNLSQNFALKTGMVGWTDISIYQGLQLLPDGRGKQVLAENCLGCHGFQSKMAAFRFRPFSAPQPEPGARLLQGLDVS